jgi:hypothetical protein
MGMCVKVVGDGAGVIASGLGNVIEIDVPGTKSVK